ncbi:hypothetical protein B0T25DRAFT_48371 [Lasiosphaeria hispida]|uniref:Proteophosphoglycan ppg4 n=1 Tax=Lasiosphaeria hispida TaxID=260671 RepID=A0AAJ0HVN3_9PEZI|nr:hypothetical protein B0T25DRAFT_48371 [Lasiosphaeria hispida]
MGNSQSSVGEPRRRSQRLSKANTGNHATAGLLSPGVFSNRSKRFSNARLSLQPPPPSPVSTPTTATSSSTAKTSDSLDTPRIERSASAVSVQQKESRRRSLFRSNSSQAVEDPERRHRSSNPASRVADKLGRTNSMTYESAISYYGQPAPESWSGQPRSRTSWNYDMSSYEAKRLLNLDEEPASEQMTAMSENRVTVVTETTWKSSNPTHPPTNPPSTTISRANSDLSLYMPVRRRSVIQKPGVATRSNSTRESPAQSRMNFRYSHPPTPNLSRQQSFESYQSGVLSMPPRIPDTDVPRVVTPCEDEYQSIGAFKLGSLRITNGAASPASPEIEKSRRRGHTNQGSPGKRDGDDYFSKTSIDEPSVVTAMPPLAFPKLEAPQPRSLQLSPIATSFLSVDVASTVSGSVPTDLTSTTSASTVQPDYLADISFSPFSLLDPLPISPQLQTTSKATAAEDQLFEDEAQPEYDSVEVLDVRLDPSAKSQHGQTDGEASKSFPRTDSGFVSTRSPSEYSHKPLTKADSGYSSNVSLRSFQLKAQDRELTLVLDKPLSHSSQRSGSVQSEERSLSSFQTAHSHPLPPQREAPPPPVPPKDFPSTSPTQSKASPATRPGQPSSNRSKEAPRATRLPPTQLASFSSGDSGPRSPESMPRTPVSATSVKSDNSASALSISSGSHKPSKLQRLLSGARRPTAGPLTVHTTHVVEKSDIPAIPQDVETKFHEHTGLFPLTTKRLALKPRSSFDTLKTIFSVGSMEASLEAVNAIPSVAKVPEEEEEEAAASETKETSWRHTLQGMPSSIAHVASHVIPKKPIPRKPVPARQESVKGKEKEQVPQKVVTPESLLPSEADLSSYSSITASLGNNAYDAAFVAMTGSRDGAMSPRLISRTMSLTESAVRYPDMRSPTLTNSPLDLPSPALPSPLLARALSMEARERERGSPPTSMNTRRPMSLRVPPPLRSQSSTASLSRKASRESIQSYPSSQQLAKKPSRNNIHSYPSFQQVMSSGSGRSDSSPPIPPMDPRRIMSFRHSQPPQPKTPKWNVQTDHDPSDQASRPPSAQASRRNSMSSVQGQDGYAIQRPSSAQSWQVRTARPQKLKHRASYDGFNHPQKRAQSGHPPSMSNGYSGPKQTYNPWSSNSELDPGAGQWLQDGRYPPYVPRGHNRNRSVSRSAHGPNAPFRILHSYNSPAYRNAPIWG